MAPRVKALPLMMHVTTLFALTIFFIINGRASMELEPEEIKNKNNSSTLLLREQRNLNNDTSTSSHCRTLWFAGFYDGRSHMDSYAQYYSAALLSAKESAPGLLQPVLLVGHLEQETSSDDVQRAKERFYQWVQHPDRGGIVIHVDRLSFQDIVNQYYGDLPPSHRQGPFLRMDVPHITQEHGLLQREGVCQHSDVAMYTDCDVIFVNVTASSLRKAKDLVSGHNNKTELVAYGPQSRKEDKAQNTGVMFFSVSKFGQQLPHILDFGREHSFKFPAFDQGLMNAFFGKKPFLRAMLPKEWNYKAYWGLPPSPSSDDDKPRVIHFHGPKPNGQGLDCLASMEPSLNICAQVIAPYQKLVDKGFEADRGLLANQTVDRFYRLVGSYDWNVAHNASRAL